MNPLILPPATGKLLVKQGSLAFVWQLVEEWKSRDSNLLNSALKFSLCRILLVQRDIYIYIYIYIPSKYPRTVGGDYSLHRIYEEDHINLWEWSVYGYR